MRNLKTFFKYLLITFISANIPWVGVGVLVGWPAVLTISITLFLLDPVLRDSNKAEVFLITAFVGALWNVVNELGWGLFITQSVPNMMMTFLAIPSILIGSLIVVAFHKQNPVCTCEVHK